MSCLARTTQRVRERERERMKVASKVILLFNDPQGFGGAFYNALQPHPKDPLLKSEHKFELSLVEYGIKDKKACGHLANFIDNNNLIQVSLLLVEHYEPPVLSCVVNEVLKTIIGENQSSKIMLTLPYILSASKLKGDDKNSSVNNKSSLYGMNVGPASNFTVDIVGTVERPPSSLQIPYEPLACLLQFVHCLKFPTAILIGKRGMNGEQEVLLELGEHLASAFALSFERSRIQLNIGQEAKAEEPWRALYG